MDPAFRDTCPKFFLCDSFQNTRYWLQLYSASLFSRSNYLAALSFVAASWQWGRNERKSGYCILIFNIAWGQIVRKNGGHFLAKTSKNIQHPYTPRKHWRRWNELFGTPAVFHLYENRKEMTWHVRVTDNAERKGQYQNASS